MNQPIEVLIAIQARSNSTRFPKKIYEHVGDKRVLDHVIEQAKSVCRHFDRDVKKIKVKCQVAVLHPENDDELVKTFRSSGAIMIGGDEHDVLSRFVQAQRMTDADFVVRVTSDCPLIFDYVISKHITMAIFKQHDYVSNVEESCRFIADGFDCEIMSRRAVKWLEDNVSSDDDKEHVTTAIRRVRPRELSQGFISSKLDTSRMKMSVDTVEDLERIREYHHEREHKMNKARLIFGSAVYEL